MWGARYRGNSRALVGKRVGVRYRGNSLVDGGRVRLRKNVCTGVKYVQNKCGQSRSKNSINMVWSSGQWGGLDLVG